MVKCLVDNIVVDITYQMPGGLCTVGFLESMDRKIQNHLFKRSIILVRMLPVRLIYWLCRSLGLLG